VGDVTDALTADQAAFSVIAGQSGVTASQAHSLRGISEGFAWAGRALTAYDVVTADPGERGYKIADAAIGEVLGKYFGVPGLLASVAFDQIGGSKTVDNLAEAYATFDVVDQLDAACHGTWSPR